MNFDLILRRACVGRGEPTIVDIGIVGGYIAEIAPMLQAEAPEKDLAGKFVVPGFVETHIHLDKSCILDRCTSEQGTLAEGVNIETRQANSPSYPRSRQGHHRASFARRAGSGFDFSDKSQQVGCHSAFQRRC